MAAEGRGLDDRDRRYLREVVFGVERLRGRLDHLLDRHLRQGIGSVRGALLDILRLGAYEALHLDSVPDYAAVSQSVTAARGRAGAGAGRLVNGVLRSLVRAGEDPSLFPPFGKDPAGHLSTWGSHPRWLVERWVDRWGAEAVARLVEWDNEIPELFLRPVGLDEGAASEALAAAGIEAKVVGHGTGCLRLGRTAQVEEALATIPAVVQDPGAALVPRFADPAPGEVVADLCAAPGGKTVLLAEAGAQVVAADRSPRRLRLVRANLVRTGAQAFVVAARAEAPPLVPGSVPLVLLDVPCSGTGTLRRHPDGKWRLTPELIAELGEVQDRILDGGATLVRPGGVLVYATCSLEAEENEARVESFLARHPEFEVEPGKGVPDEFVDGRGFLRVLPQIHGFDGAFAARMRRL